MNAKVYYVRLVGGGKGDWLQQIFSGVAVFQKQIKYFTVPSTLKDTVWSGSHSDRKESPGFDRIWHWTFCYILCNHC